jgi:hypothetical protein
MARPRLHGLSWEMRISLDSSYSRAQNRLSGSGSVLRRVIVILTEITDPVEGDHEWHWEVCINSQLEHVGSAASHQRGHLLGLGMENPVTRPDNIIQMSRKVSL